MTKSELIEKISTDKKYLSICKRVTKNRDYKDLLQELILHFLGKDEELIQNIKIPDAYIYRTILSLISKGGKFHNKYRTYICEEIKDVPDDIYNDKKESDLVSLENELNKIYWCDREVLKVYIDKGTIRKTAKALKIPLSSTKIIIDRTKKTIRRRMAKPKILIMVQYNITGLQYHRQVVPHERLTKTHPDEFEFFYLRPDSNNDETNVDWMTDEQLKEYSAVVFLRQISFNLAKAQERIDRLKYLGIKIFMDIDDIWELPKSHFWYSSYIKNNVQASVTSSLKQVDYVTTTTSTFTRKINEYNPNTTVLPNCISPDANQFKEREIKNNRMRFGWIGGVFHKEDIKIMSDGIKRLYDAKELKDKWQLCLGGYGNNPEYNEIERVLSNNYYFKESDVTYYEYLMQQTQLCEHISYDKCYRRLYGREINSYGELYNEIDVALIPLQDNKFNNCKSELKIVEAGWMKKAVIVSCVTPYKEWIKDGVNGLIVKPARNNIDWFNAIHKLINNPNMVEDLAGRLHETIIKNFDLDTHNLKRVELYKQLIK